MNKAFKFVLIPLLVILLIFIILDNKKPIETKIITIKTKYISLYSKSNNKIEFFLYTNDLDTPLIKEDAISSIYVVNNDKTKKLSLEILNIKNSHNEFYQNETFYMFIYEFKFPNLISDYLIENAYLEINLVNNETYKFEIGYFKLIYIDNAIEIPWISIDSKKNDPNDYKVSQILLELSNEIKSLVSVNLKDDEFNFKYIDNNLVVNIDYDKYFINNLPLIIETDSKLYYLNNYRYFTEYELLDKATELITIYNVNQNN